MKKKKT